MNPKFPLEVHGRHLDERADLDLVLVHGHNMHPRNLLPFADSLGVHARVVAPKAPYRVSRHGWSWWPDDPELLFRRLAGGPTDLHDLRPRDRVLSRSALKATLTELGFPRPGARAVILGFSQGGMLACDLLLHEAVKMDAAVLVSSSCIALDEWRVRASKLAGVPVLVAHGRNDDRVRFSAGVRLRDFLVEAGADVSWRPFDGGHELSLPVWRHVRKLLHDIVDRTPVS